MERLENLKRLVAANPGDAFARYGLAMEYSSSGQVEAALAEFADLLRRSPDYTAGYFMAAQTLAQVRRNAEAKKMLVNGIASAVRTRNAHAKAEMEEMLQELEDSS